MRTLPGTRRELTTARTREGGRAGAAPLMAAVGLSLLGFLAIGLAGARPATAAEPTLSPFVAGHHVYDYGQILSAHSAAAAEALAAHIEAAGGGRVALYTASESSNMPDTATLAAAWQVDGLLVTGQGGFGEMVIGPTLKGKLTAQQAEFIGSNSTPGPQTTESWMLSTLARVDALLSGTHVFDGTGILDASGRQQAESAATTLAGKIGATVYVDIALGGDDPSTAAFFNGAGMTSDLGKSVVIALAVSGTQIGGYIDFSSDAVDSYTTNTPWKNDTLANETAPNGDVRAALLAAISAVQQPPLISSDAIPWIVFVVVVVIFSITAPFLWGPWLIRKLTGTSGPIKGGLPGDAVIESISDTGITVTMPGTGPEAPEYKFELQVTPAGGGAPYAATVKAIVPRIFIPMIVPGARVGVLIDPANPMKMSVDFSRVNSPSQAESGGFGAGGAGGMDINFNASGQPESGQVAALVGAVSSGTLPTIKGSADHILAIGTHGTAVITTAQPLGKKVRDINPSADPSRLDDPIWLFTLEVSLAGQAPFPAVFGHRVPLAKVAMVAPGVKLAVAVDPANPGQDVAIDWDRSPIA